MKLEDLLESHFTQQFVAEKHFVSCRSALEAQVEAVAREALGSRARLVRAFRHHFVDEAKQLSGIPCQKMHQVLLAAQVLGCSFELLSGITRLSTLSILTQ